jgi:hypothetical protein
VWVNYNNNNNILLLFEIIIIIIIIILPQVPSIIIKKIEKKNIKLMLSA